MAVHYVPAGAETYYRSGPVALYSKYEPSDVEYSVFGRKNKRWVTKTQKIELCSGGVSQCLPSSTYDNYASLYSPEFIHNLGLKIILANPEINPYDKRTFRDRGIYTILDSGGFQMLSAKCTFVSPDDVISRYNGNADIGMPLDVPCKALYERAYFNRISHIMKANDDYILPRLNKGIKYALISHGTTLDYRKARLDILDRKADVIAVAGLNINPKSGNPIFSKVEQLMYVLERYRKTTSYFHVLGVTDRFFLLVYSLLDNMNYVKNIGADSVSHRINALSGIQLLSDFTTRHIEGSLKWHTTSQCNCPVCSVCDDARILHECTLLESHNLYACVQRLQNIQQLADLYIKDQLSLESLYSNTAQSIDYSTFKTAIKYVEECVSNKFKPLTKAKTKGLFGTKQQVMHTSDHYEKIIQNYSKFHGKAF